MSGRNSSYQESDCEVSENNQYGEMYHFVMNQKPQKKGSAALPSPRFQLRAETFLQNEPKTIK